MPSLFATGSLITSRNYYFFQEPITESKKYYISRYRVFKVWDLKKNKKGEYFFLVRANTNKKVNAGKGYIFAADNILENKEQQLFLTIPQTLEKILDYYLVPIDVLTLTEEKIKSKLFPFQVWQKVNYNFDLPEEVWAANNAVIYRLNQSTQWLENKLQEIVEQDIEKNKWNLILAGDVEKGFSKEEIILSLGNPITNKLVEQKEELEYTNQKILLENNKLVEIITIK